MSNFIMIDSVHRDRENYPNENDYELTPSQVETWFRASRSVRAYPQNASTQPLEFVTDLEILSLIVPYTIAMSKVPVVFVNFRSSTYKDIRLIATINGTLSDAKFACYFDKIQYDDFNNPKTPVWIHYRCPMVQTMRFVRDMPVTFQLFTRSGSIPPQQDNDLPDEPDPDKQTILTVQLVPYLRNSSWSGHSIVPTPLNS